MAAEKTSEFTLDATPGAGSYVPYVDPTEAADADKNKRILFSDVGSAAGLVIGTDVQAFDAANVTDTSTSTLTNKTISSLTNQVVADEIHFEIRNESGGTLTKGTPVFVSGFNVGQDLVEVDSADATSSATMQAIGLIEADVATGATGSAVSMGVLEGLDTSSYSVGDVLYVSETAGTLTATAPTGSALAQEVGVVIRSNPSTGSILISMTETNLTGFAYTLLDDGDAATARTTLGVAIGTDVQAHSAVLDATTASFTTAKDSTLSSAAVDYVSPAVVTGTTDTLASADHATTNRYTNAALVTVTIPTDASDDLPDGFWCLLFAEGAGGVTLSTTGVTLAGSSPNTTIAQNEGMVVQKTTTANTWLVLGGTAA